VYAHNAAIINYRVRAVVVALDVNLETTAKEKIDSEEKENPIEDRWNERPFFT